MALRGLAASLVEDWDSSVTPDYSEFVELGQEVGKRSQEKSRGDEVIGW